ncbi:hypothetical protein MGN70_013193 [Eutypa lata]|nr:hypothetical protein MGN70_013193 [Eutypa lata]
MRPLPGGDVNARSEAETGAIFPRRSSVGAGEYVPRQSRPLTLLSSSSPQGEWDNKLALATGTTRFRAGFSFAFVSPFVRRLYSPYYQYYVGGRDESNLGIKWKLEWFPENPPRHSRYRHAEQGREEKEQTRRRLWWR